jgi:hypothetical protein
MMLILAGMTRPYVHQMMKAANKLWIRRKEGKSFRMSTFNLRRGKHQEKHIPEQAKANPRPDAVESPPVC